MICHTLVFSFGEGRTAAERDVFLAEVRDICLGSGLTTGMRPWSRPLTATFAPTWWSEPTATARSSSGSAPRARLVTFGVPGADGDTRPGRCRGSFTWFDTSRTQLLRQSGKLDGGVVTGTLTGHDASSDGPALPAVLLDRDAACGIPSSRSPSTGPAASAATGPPTSASG